MIEADSLTDLEANQRLAKAHHQLAAEEVRNGRDEHGIILHDGSIWVVWATLKTCMFEIHSSKVTLQWKMDPVEDVFLIENQDVPLQCHTPSSLKLWGWGGSQDLGLIDSAN